jgi:membrane-associated phospholipid phosphatase
LLVVLTVLAIAALSGCAVGVAIRRWPVGDVAQSVTLAIGREVHRRGRLARFFRARVDPAAATGLVLTVAFSIVVIGGGAFGVLFYIVRAHTGPAGIDRSLAVWGATHATGLSTAVLRVITQLGATLTIVAVTVLAGAWEYRRVPSRAVPLFLALVVGGQNVASNLIKLGVDRVRPGIDPLTLTSGSSFPSGHATAAAACYAAIALLAGRRRSPGTRSILAGAATAIAVAVATSRVLLGVHWLTDVLAGLALGWGWFALCSIAFGGRMLRFGNPASGSGGARNDPTA